MKVTKKRVVIGLIVTAVLLWGYVIVGYMSDVSGGTRSVVKTNVTKNTPKPTDSANKSQPAPVVAQTQPANVNETNQPVYKPVVNVNKTTTVPTSANSSPTSQASSQPAPVPAPVSSQPAPAQPAPQPSSNQGACPAPTSQGAYYQRGTNPDGTPACGFAYYNACPYSEGVSANDPMCYKGQVK